MDLLSTAFPAPIGTPLAPFAGVCAAAGPRSKGLVIEDTIAASRPLGLFGVPGPPALIERRQLMAPSVRSTRSMSVGTLVGELAPQLSQPAQVWLRFA